MIRVTARTGRGIVVLLMGLGLIAGCMPGVTPDELNVIEPAATAIPSGTGDPRAAPAVSTYLAFIKATNHLMRHPVLPTRSRYPDASDFTRYSVDPVQSQYEGFVSTLVRTHHAFRGSAPKSKVTVTSINLNADPRPVITLADCQTNRDRWRAYDTRTNVMNPQMTPALAAPYGITVTVVFAQQRWRVETIKPDPAGQCAG